MRGTRSSTKRQTRLNFNPVLPSSPGHEHSSSQAPDRFANVRYSPASSSPLAPKHAVRRQPPRSQPIPMPKLDHKMLSDSDEEEEEEDEEIIRAPNSTRKSRKHVSPSRSPIKSRARKVGLSDSDDDIDDDDEEDEIIRPRCYARKSGKRASPSSNPNLPSTRNPKLPDKDDDKEDDDDSEIIQPPSSTRRLRKRHSPSSTPNTSRALRLKTSYEDSDEEDDNDDDDEEEEIHVPGSTRRNSKREVVVLSEDSNNNDEDSDDLLIQSPAKRRRRNSDPRTPIRAHGRSEQDMRDLEEDLEVLRDSAVTKRRTRGEAAQSAVKLRRKEQLEALRRRRAGDKRPSTMIEKAEEEEEEEEDVKEGQEQEYSDSDSSISTSSDEDIPEDSDIEPPAPEDLDEYEKDFVLEDDDAAIGVPTDIVDMPFEFSRHRYKRLSDHFRDVVEWMVHNKLNPAFPRDDQLYKVAFDKVTDEVMGVTGSQLLSSVWNVDFVRALQARPGIEVRPFPVSENYKCDACNRSKHPASSDIRFTGKPYLLETLEPICDEDDDSSSSSSSSSNDDDDDDKENIDRAGHPIPPASTHFHLGSFCASKATMAHTLLHWRVHLNEWVLDYLARKGVFSDTQILEREHLSVKKRTRYANEVVDRMKGEGEIERLWRDFGVNLKTAREHGNKNRWS